MSSLQDLLALQDLDLQLDQARHRRELLPERGNLLDIDRAGADANRQMVAAEAAAAEVGARQATAEAELTSTEERIAAMDKKLYSGEVTASRELQALSAEVEHLRTRVSGIEDDILRLIDEKEPFDRSAAELRHTVAELAGRRAEAAQRLEAAEATIDAELAALEERREQAAALISPEQMAVYERLRGRLAGVAVARLVGNHCDGCHLTLSAVELDRVRHLPEGEIYTCEQCSRILVP